MRDALTLAAKLEQAQRTHAALEAKVLVARENLSRMEEQRVRAAAVVDCLRWALARPSDDPDVVGVDLN